MNDVIQLESDEENIFSDLLNYLFEHALNGDKQSQIFLEKKIFFENWESIQEKYKAEGSTWYVWWMDGVHALMKERKKDPNEDNGS